MLSRVRVQHHSPPLPSPPTPPLPCLCLTLGALALDVVQHIHLALVEDAADGVLKGVAHKLGHTCTTLQGGGREGGRNEVVHVHGSSNNNRCVSVLQCHHQQSSSSVPRGKKPRLWPVSYASDEPPPHSTPLLLATCVPAHHSALHVHVAPSPPSLSHPHPPVKLLSFCPSRFCATLSTTLAAISSATLRSISLRCVVREGGTHTHDRDAHT